MSDTKIHIDIECHAVLSVRQVWPDGDAPEEITSEVVLAVIRKSLRVSEIDGQASARLISEWCLDRDTSLDVKVTG